MNHSAIVYAFEERLSVPKYSMRSNTKVYIYSISSLKYWPTIRTKRFISIPSDKLEARLDLILNELHHKISKKPLNVA